MHAHARIPETLEREEARQALQRLSLVPDEASAAVTIPASAVKPLLQILALIAAGQSPTVHGDEEEFTTQEAANFLKMSRPTLLKRLDEGEIPFHRVGTHRRVKLVDVLRYRETTRLAGIQALRELVAEEEALGLRD